MSAECGRLKLFDQAKRRLRTPSVSWLTHNAEPCLDLRLAVNA
ncbi:MAG: hypothetical protein FD139_2761 [Methylocystaceae bacterium]|nr:MAG: hypothetical protein FD148_117 [Methylocystaceae bacterium]TXT43679.1 MAG: hypothetical protein FD139_2761 [Methylocystaceae bacterium]